MYFPSEMHITVQKDRKTIQQNFSGSALQLLTLLEINPETVLIVKDGILITTEDDVSDAKHIELLSVVSGG